MKRMIRIGLAVLVGFPLISLFFLFPGGTAPRAQAPAKKAWEGPPQT